MGTGTLVLGFSPFKNLVDQYRGREPAGWVQLPRIIIRSTTWKDISPAGVFDLRAVNPLDTI